ncbi:sensor histidine kinase [Flagellimonas zhangzhouensis]|uniref:histidine kinase n=1 Tax=Flagellimonas zhangzhouensis TaxID=1073328 RepID=A0A1H2WTA2_9FLAO|nr:HAMP domain-containing sensor histidine kinase [Allomuricauda zhangzhouensis]SDQ24018.1 HAMP domain-containing protein [Allomuricauda zhangzhouensis]SDW83189.1 HAMP domain-containing protein [Allomuricauda zhangzhouensis]
MKNNILSTRFILKLVLSFSAILVLAGVGYTFISFYFSNKYFFETTQRLHSNLAQDLIDEKFKDAHPFDSTGLVNKELFGDIMHDMMAVNRAIEVYLLDSKGHVQYSVVLNHDAPETKLKQIDLAPIKKFIADKGSHYIVGDDPKDLTKQTVFSAAHFNKEGREGYIYIILAGEDFIATRSDLFSSYFMRLGMGGSILTLIFATILGVLAIWHLTRSLREIIYAAERFREGDLKYRIENAEKTDLSNLATTFNGMADTILADMEKIKSIEELRRELIANISHDLRTPLSIIQGYIETLHMKGSQLSVEEKDVYLKTISKSSEKLSKLISQLFEYSKLEANQIQPQKEPFLINELANDIHRNYSLITEQKNIELKLSMDDNIPLVFADISLVERAIQNLMDNALKFTPIGGTVIVQIRAMEKHVQITVQDSGPGIAKENQALIFERYRQTKVGQQKEGIGLGLAIVKKIMEIHDSHIKVLSQPNQGTSFSFELPVHFNQ